MNTGALRHRVTLDTTDGAGGVTPLDPAEWDCAHVADGAGTATIVGRYRGDITTATRVHFKDRLYHIVSLVNTEERDAEWVLSCTEVFD